MCSLSGFCSHCILASCQEKAEDGEPGTRDYNGSKRLVMYRCFPLPPTLHKAVISLQCSHTDTDPKESGHGVKSSYSENASIGTEDSNSCDQQFSTADSGKISWQLMSLKSIGGLDMKQIIVCLIITEPDDCGAFGGKICFRLMIYVLTVKNSVSR